MIQIVNTFKAGNIVWAYVVENNRACYYGVPIEEDSIPSDEKLVDAIIEDGFTPAHLPDIEQASPALQELYRNTAESSASMCFVGNDDEWYWNDLGIEQHEFERQIDDDIKKYGLEDVIESRDNDCLYICYGNLQSRFSEAHRVF